MHELSIVQNLISLAEKELAQAGHEGPVAALTVKIGRLSGANPEAMRFAFDIVSQTSILAGARLDITETRPSCICRECGRSQEIEEAIFECPFCGAGDIEIQGGRELFLESIEVEVETSEVP